MTRFFDKDLADHVSYGIATHAAAVATELHADIERMNAMRKAEGARQSRRKGSSCGHSSQSCLPKATSLILTLSHEYVASESCRRVRMKTVDRNKMVGDEHKETHRRSRYRLRHCDASNQMDAGATKN